MTEFLGRTGAAAYLVYRFGIWVAALVPALIALAVVSTFATRDQG